jgi:tRNA(adenine34) deaminase
MTTTAGRSAPRHTPGRQRSRRRRRVARYWVRTVTTVSTAPPAGLFTRDAATIARVLASRRVSPKGITSGLRMLLFYINRAGIQLSGRQRTELLKAKRLLQQRLAERQQAHALRKPGRPRQGP